MHTKDSPRGERQILASLSGHYELSLCVCSFFLDLKRDGREAGRTGDGMIGVVVVVDNGGEDGESEWDTSPH